ncbi:MAG TPA: alpha/beta hydrolase [Gammaproteobacteria bacterium]|nr:alpha/beta hydrolase [Gammaproteobacteria bacterium]
MSTSNYTDNPPPQLLTLGNGNGNDTRRIAIRARSGASPGLFWLGGFMSDMQGTKAAAIDHFAKNQNRACVRFDYSGHGESTGEFKEGTIGRWLEESLAVFETYCEGPQVVIGSSMGGWLALLLAKALRQRQPAKQSIAGLVLIAPAVDFTEVLISQKLPEEMRQEIEQQGFLLQPSEYSEQPYCITRQLLEEGRNHLLLGQTIETTCPVRIIQGMEDVDVPWTHVSELLPAFSGGDVVLTLIKDGDHRLARPQDINRLLTVVQEFTAHPFEKRGDTCSKCGFKVRLK